MKPTLPLFLIFSTVLITNMVFANDDAIATIIKQKVEITQTEEILSSPPDNPAYSETQPLIELTPATEQPQVQALPEPLSSEPTALPPSIDEPLTDTLETTLEEADTIWAVEPNVDSTESTNNIEPDFSAIENQTITTSNALPYQSLLPFQSKSNKKADLARDYIVYEAQNSDWVATNPNPYTANEPWLVVGAQSQTMKHYDSWGRLAREYPISTATRGVGELENSYKTPRGYHKVCERIGDGLPARTIFSRRKALDARYTKELHEEYPKKDWILTRIMWLCGQEEGKNKGYNDRGQVVDSYKRYIYIHGSGDHAPFGRAPSSLGCVRMISEDVIDVFNNTKMGLDVYIEEFK